MFDMICLACYDTHRTTKELLTGESCADGCLSDYRLPDGTRWC